MAKKYFDTMPESLEDKIKKIFGETVAKEGNKFTKALMAARENGKKFFSVNGREYKTEDYAEKPGLVGEQRGPVIVGEQKKLKASHKKEDNTNDKSDDGEGLDKVQPKAVKKKFADRKDKDIDNDGDVDSSDKYLHKRRKAISKAVKEEMDPRKHVAKSKRNPDKFCVFDKDGNEVKLFDTKAEAEKYAIANHDKLMGESVADIIQNKNYSMREALAKVWEASAHKNPFEMFGANTPSKPNQGAATVKRDQAAAAKARASGDKSNPGSFGKKKPISSQKKTDTGKPVTKVEINPKV